MVARVTHSVFLLLSGSCFLCLPSLNWTPGECTLVCRCTCVNSKHIHVYPCAWRWENNQILFLGAIHSKPGPLTGHRSRLASGLQGFACLQLPSTGITTMLLCFNVNSGNRVQAIRSFTNRAASLAQSITSPVTHRMPISTAISYSIMIIWFSSFLKFPNSLSLSWMFS